MPKVTLPVFPVSALFAINKPSGPTSMSVINDIKILVGSSRLFVDQKSLDARRPKRRRGKQTDAVKIGQGGTLDPLADGVLGNSHSPP